MDSASLLHLGVNSWASFVCTSEHDVLAGLPKSPGVYIIILPEPEQRTLGASDIVYVGKATNRKGLHGRVRQYFHPGWMQSTNKAMKKRLHADGCALRIGFILRDSSLAASHLESQILTRFESEHGELPPYNRMRGLKLVPLKRR